MGAEVKAKDSRGIAPIHYASMIGSQQIVEMLEKGGASAFTTTKSGLNCLHFACKHGHLELVKYFLDNYELDVNELTKSGNNSALHYAAEGSHVDIMKVLLENEGNPTLLNKNFDDCLFIAIHTPCIDIVKLILEKHDFDVNRVNQRTGLTYFAYAVLKNQFTIADEIKNYCEKKELTLNTNPEIVNKEKEIETLTSYCKSNGYMKALEYLGEKETTPNKLLDKLT